MERKKGRKKERKKEWVSAKERFFSTKPTHKCNNIISWIQFFSSFIFILFLSTFFFPSSLSYSGKKEKKKIEREKVHRQFLARITHPPSRHFLVKKELIPRNVLSLSLSLSCQLFHSFSFSLVLSPPLSFFLFFPPLFFSQERNESQDVKGGRRRKFYGSIQMATTIKVNEYLPPWSFFPFLLFFLFLFLSSLLFSPFSHSSLISLSLSFLLPHFLTFLARRKKGRRVFSWTGKYGQEKWIGWHGEENGREREREIDRKKEREEDGEREKDRKGRRERELFFCFIVFTLIRFTFFLFFHPSHTMKSFLSSRSNAERRRERRRREKEERNKKRDRKKKFNQIYPLPSLSSSHS